MIKIVFTYLALMISCTMIAQTATDTLLRYNKAIKYLSENKVELKKEWLSLFKGSTKKEVKKRIGEQFNYKVSSIICFLPMLPFQDIQNVDSITFHSSLEINEPSVYSSRYSFASFTSNYLLDKKLTDTTISLEMGEFVVNFSRPINNYLIAEVSGYKDRLKQCYVKIMARTMWMLFIFSKEEKLAKVYYSYVDH